MSTISTIPHLYPYQEDLVEQIRERLRSGSRRVLLQAPTGCGKGTIATRIIRSAVNRGRRVLFLVNRRELVKDLSRRLDRLGLDHGVIMGNHPRRKPWLSVHVASIDTLHRRETLPPADLLFCDECHFSISPTWLKVIERYACPVIGMSATPVRADGRGLGELYDCLIQGPSIKDLTERGFLVPTRIFAPPGPNLEGVRLQCGEYNQKQLGAAVDRAQLVGNVVEHYLRIGRGRPTVCFPVNVAHSQHIVEQFKSAGIRAVHIDANSPDELRDRTWLELADGITDICSSVGVISYGWDVPAVSCAILARPTMSLGLYLQQVGRVLRTAPGKADALILDHAGSVMAHGFPDDDREWTLDGVNRRDKEKLDPAFSVRMCPECWCAYPATLDACPACGKVREKKIAVPEATEGTLEEITDRAAYVIHKLSSNPKIRELQEKAAERGYKPGYVYYGIQRLRRQGAIT